MHLISSEDLAVLVLYLKSKNDSQDLINILRKLEKAEDGRNIQKTNGDEKENARES